MSASSLLIVRVRNRFSSLVTIKMTFWYLLTTYSSGPAHGTKRSHTPVSNSGPSCMNDLSASSGERLVTPGRICTKITSPWSVANPAHLIFGCRLKTRSGLNSGKVNADFLEVRAILHMVLERVGRMDTANHSTLSYKWNWQLAVVVASHRYYPGKSYIRSEGRKLQAWWFDESVCFVHVCKFRKLDLLRVRAPILFLPRDDTRTRTALGTRTGSGGKRLASLNRPVERILDERCICVASLATGWTCPGSHSTA